MTMTAHTLLLVDNDERIVELLTWYLQSKGFRVRSAYSFAAAREALAEERPDLLVSDVDLGVESALIELPQMSAEGILPRTLVVSGYLDAEVRAKLDAVPEVMGAVAKPFEFEDLERSIVVCLEAPDGARVDLPTPAGTLPEAVAEPEPDEDGWIEITPR